MHAPNAGCMGRMRCTGCMEPHGPHGPYARAAAWPVLPLPLLAASQTRIAPTRPPNPCIFDPNPLQTNLTWLDLSFNQITDIEGLEALTRLQDLSLFSNKIVNLGGLDALADLNVLSIGALAG